MQEIKRIMIEANNVRSLCWQGDELVDWVGGGNRFSLAGTTHRSYVNWAYRFNRAVASPDGLMAVLYEAGGTKGIVLKDGSLVREIDRSFYHADVYEYPVTLFDLPDGRTALVHCPEEYNKLEIEDAETGECLTKRGGETVDFFQSRLQVSPGSRYLMSAGWIWHPFDDVLIYDIEQVLARPELLDSEPDWGLGATGTEINNAAFAEAGIAIFTSADAYYDEEDGDEKGKLILRPDQIGRYSLSERRFRTIAPLEEPLGTMMPVGDFVVGFYEHPKLVEVSTGKIVARWPDLDTGNQNGSILPDFGKIPPLALDAANRRFAVADAEKITVVQLG